MKYMTHNSWTFMKPRSWIAKLLNFTIKCQSKNIQEQYEKYNVRMFDLRVRLDENNNVVIAHGLFDYENRISEDLHYLDNKRDTYVRVMWEIRKPSEDHDKQREWFIRYCSQLEEHYPNIKFCGGCPTYSYDGKIVYYRFLNTMPSVEGCHASWATKCKLDDLWPWFYAWRNNKKSRERGTSKEFLSLDFIEI